MSAGLAVGLVADELSGEGSAVGLALGLAVGSPLRLAVWLGGWGARNVLVSKKVAPTATETARTDPSIIDCFWTPPGAATGGAELADCGERWD